MISSRSLSATAELSDCRGIADSSVVKKFISTLKDGRNSIREAGDCKRHNIGTSIYAQDLLAKDWQIEIGYAGARTRVIS